MSASLKPIEEQVIVITGASSGIGLATAREAAKRGARVVLASRNSEVLAREAGDLRNEGHEAVAVAADVGETADVERILATARERFGRVDTWVNDAGVDIWGRLEEVIDEDSRRLFETNFWGTVYGSNVAAAAMRESGGAIVNVGSIAGDRAFPLQGIYCASKHAVKGFTEALRMELEEAGYPISVTLIKPAAIGSPLASHARNYLEKEPRLPSPLYAPEEVALAILYAAEHPVRDMYVGAAGRIMTLLGNGAPRLADLTGEQVLFGVQKRDVPARPRQDNLFGPGSRDGEVRFDPDGRSMHRSFSTRAR